MTTVVEEDGGQQFIDWKSGDVQREEKLVATALVGKQPMSFTALVLFAICHFFSIYIQLDANFSLLLPD